MSTDLVETNADKRRHELLADLAEQSAKFALEKLAGLGITEEQALELGNDLADFICTHWNGQNIYMVSDAQYKLSKRDLMIYERMQRGNAHELAKELGISYVRVYQVYKRCLAAARAKSQPQLFEAAAVDNLPKGTKP
jgi:Mor family transcriptional regulator